MNDLDFARHVSVPIGQLYDEAKRSQYQFPRNTLIAVRSIASLCCNLLAPSDDAWPDGLDDKIKALDRTRCINRVTREQLNQLRNWGNRAAHPEAGLLGEADQQALAGHALTVALSLFETVFQHNSGGAALPVYTLSDERPDELREACYRALMESSAADQYRVAMLLQSQMKAKVEQAQAEPDSELAMYRLRYDFASLDQRLLDMLRYASDAGYAPARYQYGLALVDGRRGPDQATLGAHLIAMACRDGDIDAIAWCGQAALYGLFDEPLDHVHARSLLERAAAEDHPLALTLLSLIYSDGLGVAPDATRAFELTLRAADAGYALAQYNAAVALVHGHGVVANHDEGFRWLRQASDAGLPEAQYALAKAMQEQRIRGDALEIEQLLGAAAERVNAAHLDLAELCMTQDDHRKWLEAAGRIQIAYETALKEEDTTLAERCRAAGPAIIARLEAALPTMSVETSRDFMTTRFIFDAKGRPYPNRAERMARMVDIARELVRVRGTGSAEEIRLQRELWSNLGGLKTLSSPRSPGNNALPFMQRIVRNDIGRNEPCPCGSGKKHKRCCG
ncbi:MULTISPECIES: tetratricopeptide repeat protein [unclassified Massilia]|uniref:tetratricopeptide repeat protein n=1 Tax=unclassified Massilia TaxID=2609279 RepID=UPI00177E9A2F|nr:MULTISPECIES: tetratricopeptide repeat protein [unclassified Massilia]MBD8529367.1 SEL1-like repeat protein [Massilia sp. CFBP 13647]MBD8672760.1 SEL1-like repeat protein [Massilia sp. CFBP 13721]